MPIINRCGGGDAIKEPYDFPLSMQTSAPTPVNTNHIWIHNDRKMNLIIEEAVLSSNDNCYALIEDTMDNTYNYFTVPKTLTSGEHLRLSIYKPARDNVPWRPASWIGFAKKYGIYFNQDYYTKWPRVYSKINGVVDMEDAQRWDGSAWQWLSQKGNYLFSSQGHVLNRAEGVVQNDRELFTASNDMAISADRNYIALINSGMSLNIYKRIGDAYSLISTFDAKGLYVAFSPDSQYIAVAASKDFKIYKKKTDGSWEQLGSYTDMITASAEFLTGIAFTPDGSKLVVTTAIVASGGTYDLNMHRYTRNNDTFVKSLSVYLDNWSVTTQNLQTRDGYVHCEADRTLCSYNLNTGANKKYFSAQGYAPNYSYMISNGRTVVCGRDGKIYMLNSSDLSTIFYTSYLDHTSASGMTNPRLTVTADEKYAIILDAYPSTDCLVTVWSIGANSFTYVSSTYVGWAYSTNKLLAW